MCYYCLDELFELARLGMDEDILAASGSSRCREKLQSAVIPLLVLRCALPLKMYIADQPLRGNMPTPMSQRLELLHILDKITQFGSQRLNRDTKRSLLGRLAPLIHEAAWEVKRDSRLLDAMQTIMTNVWESME